MGSVEEERLVQMVHDFIESSSSSSSSSSSEDQSTPPDHHCNTFPLANQTEYYNLQEMLGRRTKAEGEVLERVLKHIIIMRNKKDEYNHHHIIRNFLVMKLNTDGFNASLCHTSWVTSFGCPAGDYEFIEIKNGKKKKKKRVIVDIEFKSQFQVARPTPFYKQLTDSLPQIFVGTEDKLIPIISLLCSAAKQSLTERGLHVPPWRTAAYMHSKWLSINSSQTQNHPRDQITNDQISNDHNFITTNKWEWAPPNPLVNNNNKTRDLGGGASALSTQFSNMSINCC